MINKDFKVFVGIDVSKDSFSVCALSSPDNILFEAKFPMSHPGFKDFSKRLAPFTKDSILIAKESSGCYYINLFAYLTQKELTLVHKIKELFFLEEQLEFFTNMLRKLCEEASLCQNIEILKPIKGIGDITAVHFLAEVGNIERVDSPKKLIGYCGIDPTVYESGRFKGKSKISKRENRHLRRIVWLMSIAVVMHNEYFRQYYNKRRTEGLVYRKAILAVAHKLLRTVWSMLTKKQPFFVNHRLSPCFSRR